MSVIMNHRTSVSPREESISMGRVNSQHKQLDYVLVYPAKPHESLIDMFLAKARDEGLIIEQKTGFIGTKEVKFVLIQATREALSARAENNKLVVTLDNRITPQVKPTFLKRFLSMMYIPQLTKDFTKSCYKQSMDYHFTKCTTDCLGSTGIRSMLVHDILKDVDISSVAGTHKYRGLLWLKSKNYILDSFVPHCDEEMKHLLKTLGGVTHTISMTAIRDYLGEKVAFTFAWRSAWLSRGLMAPIIFGLLVLIYGIWEVDSGLPSKRLQMGDGVKERYLRFIDNNVTPYYAFFMCFWAIYFSDIWRKFKHMYAFKWGVMNYHLLQERERVKFTKHIDRSRSKKILIRMISITLGTLLLILSAIYCLGIAYLEEAFTNYLDRKHDVYLLISARTTSNITVSILNGILVIFVNMGMEKVAYFLSDLEHYRYHSDFENALTWRVFINTFINNNSRILMMLLIPRFSIYNIFTNSTGNIEFCKEGHCLFAMSTQIIVFLLVKPFTRMHRYLYYLAKTWWNRRRTAGQQGYPRVVERLENEYALFRGSGYGERYYTLEDMNDRIAQYGFVVMYAAAFPFAPLIAFVIECILRKSDIHRYVCQQRRPVSRRYEGVGCWEEILDFVNMAAICTNIFIIAFRSYHGKNLFFDWVIFYGENEGPWRLAVYLETSILLLTCALRAMFQYISIPETVRQLSRLEENKAKEFMKSHECK